MLTTAKVPQTPMFAPESAGQNSTVMLGSPRERSTINTPFRPRQGTAMTARFVPATPSILSQKKPADFDFNEAKSSIYAFGQQSVSQEEFPQKSEDSKSEKVSASSKRTHVQQTTIQLSNLTYVMEKGSAKPSY